MSIYQVIYKKYDWSAGIGWKTKVQYFDNLEEAKGFVEWTAAAEGYKHPELRKVSIRLDCTNDWSDVE